jgi:tetratricopeptide (TPR) repeat protein
MRACLIVGIAAMAVAHAGCAAALHEPPPVTSPGTAASVPTVAPVDVDRALADAESAFGKRPDRAAVARSRSLFLAAARADDTRVDGLLGAARVTAWLIEHEPDGTRRAALATEAVQACQWCTRRAPASVECKYRLALALGHQARERRTTASDGLSKMVPLLQEVIEADPRLDAAGGHRVLALVLLRAPGWPAGPGDSEAALEHARKADALVPDHADTLMVLGEALAANNQPELARAAYRRAEQLAAAKAAAGDPDAAEVAAAAARALKALGRASVPLRPR